MLKETEETTFFCHILIIDGISIGGEGGAHGPLLAPPMLPRCFSLVEQTMRPLGRFVVVVYVEASFIVRWSYIFLNQN